MINNVNNQITESGFEFRAKLKISEHDYHVAYLLAPN